MRMRIASALAVALMATLGSLALSQGQQLPPGEGFTIGVLADKEVNELPAGPRFWRIETFPTLAEAEAAAGPYGLAAEADGDVWLFTLGAAGATGGGGTFVAEVGPIPDITAPSYLLRVNQANAVPGGTTSVHFHPGAEAFYALAGTISLRTADGEMSINAGQSMAGHTPGTIMQVFNGGSTDLQGLVMFVVDATQPFSTKAAFP